MQLVQDCSDALEAAGAAILKRESIPSIGAHLVQAGAALNDLSPLVVALAPDRREAQESSQRLQFAADKMNQAGNELQGIQPKATGKSWLKGGR